VDIASGGGAVIGGTTATARNVVSGNGLAGVRIQSNNTLVQGNYIGTNVAGTAAVRNGAANSATGGVWVVSGTGVVVGGTSAGAGNVLSGNGGAGVWLDGASPTTVQGNYIGTNAAGDAAIGNGRWGVHVHGNTGHQVGGSAAGAGNLISGNTGNGAGGVILWGNAHVVEGNRIGVNAAGTAFIPNGSVGGVEIRSGSGHRIGGTGAGQANTIAGNTGVGVAVNGTGNGHRVQGNSIYSNSSIGIDLGGGPSGASVGATANDGAKTTGAPNLYMDSPVLTRAVLGANTLSVVGYVGSAALQGTFGGALVDLYVNNGGQGQTYIGTVTANADGEFAGVVSTTGVSGLVAGTTAIVATATDAGGNTSEFGNALTSVALAALTNGSFEDGSPGQQLDLLTGNVSSLPGWVVTGAGVDSATYWTAAQGSHSIDLSAFTRGGVAQVVSTVPGQQYTVTYSAAGNAYTGAGNTLCGTAQLMTMRVTAGNATATQVFDSTGTNFGAPGWADRHISFTATAPATTEIRFNEDVVLLICIRTRLVGAGKA
jgi:hypothetical protein